MAAHRPSEPLTITERRVRCGNILRRLDATLPEPREQRSEAQCLERIRTLTPFELDTGVARGDLVVLTRGLLHELIEVLPNGPSPITQRRQAKAKAKQGDQAKAKAKPKTKARRK